MKKIGFLSFGHWTPLPQSQTQTAADALLQSIDLAMEAERLGVDGAYFRVHHFSATGVTVSTARGGRSQNEKD
jgi:alkanesulfonate monooxygenase SsuD/methylene tetrahydromethanopterin reductase-like flavin-dependent oxidoreductase (luciferase family)